MADDKLFEPMPYFMWTINDISSTLELESPKFTVADVEFSMLFQHYKGISAIYMTPVFEDHQSIPSYEFATSVSILTPKKSFDDFLFIQKRVSRNSTGRRAFHAVWELEMKSLDNIETVRGETGQKNVTFLCVFGTLGKYQKEADLKNSWCEFLCMERLGKDLDKLSSNEDSCIVLKCEDQTIKVHEVILSARSKVFAEMLQNKIVTRKGIEIKDMDFEVLQNCITYMYSGRLMNIKPSVSLLKKLYKTAIKYDVEPLKLMTSIKLVNILKNAVISSDPEILDKEKLSSDPEILNKEKLSSKPKILNKENLSSKPKISNKEKLSSKPEILNKEKLSSNPEILNKEKLSYVMSQKSLSDISLNLLSLAEEHKDESFKKSIILSIVHFNEFILFEEMWKTFRDVDENKELALEVYNSLINKYSA